MTVYTVQGLEQEQRSYDPIPAGVYNAIVAEAVVGPFKSGQGHKLDLTFEVTEGEFQGRKIFDMIALQHPSHDWAVSTQARLDALLKVNGVTSLNDWSQINNMQCALKVYIQKDKTGEYSDKNQVDLILPKAAAAGMGTGMGTGMGNAPTMGVQPMSVPGVQPIAAPVAAPSLSAPTTPGYAAGGPVVAAPAGVAETPGFVDDDIPF